MTASIFRETEFPKCIPRFHVPLSQRPGKTGRPSSAVWCVVEDRPGYNGGWQGTSWKCVGFPRLLCTGDVRLSFPCCLPYTCRDAKHKASEGQRSVNGETRTPETCADGDAWLIDPLKRVMIRSLGSWIDSKGLWRAVFAHERLAANRFEGGWAVGPVKWSATQHGRTDFTQKPQGQVR